ncbi:hypothetical protein BY457_11692 [Marinilabilia salmonicolor]|jgi:hypothetical protein|uniref:hypothetical protein n=1 Tax=Marinilabilia salmonicolor TaxID=989 RepID=UPI000D053C9C|nr:hypothetical protein [Marinilabilia salmonicolor]PRY96229.1 hypothetical protein BY457_11692 [Marinilabilia salmonicolor]
MKTKFFNICFSVLAVMTLLFSACQPEEYELGQMLSKEDLKYSIVQDAEDPNMVILMARNDGYAPFWTTPMGRSTRVNDTVRIPFEGNYDFVYGVVTPGGVIQADTFTLELTTTNLNYVNDPLWTKLTGGVGEEKTWLLDLNADGQSRYFVGPLYFYGTDDSWATVTEGQTIEGDTWNWQADWEGNQWIMPAADYGTMTFSLKGNATVTVNHEVLGRVDNGTYFLDADAKTLSMTDAAPLHDEGRDGQVINWGDIRVMSLTEDAMQLGVIRDEALSGEGPALLVYNYVSKEYYDNWVPEDLPDPEPELPAGWQEDISQVVSTSISWTLSDQNPIDWCNLDGTRMNGWNAPEDYPDWLGTPDPSVYEGFSLTLNSDDNTVEYVAPDGTTETGTYTLDEKGIYTFDGIAPSFSVIGWASFGLTADNQLRIMSIEKDAAGKVTGMWVGAKDPEKPEYVAYHLVPSAGGAPESDDAEPQPTVLAFDNTKLAYGDIEEKGNLRLELFNEYGSTKEDPPFSTSELASFNSLEVTFTLSGVTLTEGAEGSYDASILYADGDWNPQANGEVITVNGDGTYTATFAPGTLSEGVMVFVIDIVGMGEDIADMTAVAATIDEVLVY